MAFQRRRFFNLNEEEILQFLTADNSEDEDDLCLDEEDQIFLEGDVDAGAAFCEIDDNAVETTEQVVEITEQAPRIPENYKKKTTEKSEPNFRWRNSYTANVFPNSDYEFGKVQICDVGDPNCNLSPFQIFLLTTNFDVLIELIVHESCRYAEQNGRVFDVTADEMKAFLGINLVMTYHVLPSIRDYWSTEPDMGVPFISNVMTRKRFEDIRQNLHFSNNDEEGNRNDRAFKIRPVISHFNKAFQNAMNNTYKQAVDEHMIKFKGHNAMKQYIKNKPIKWGFKMWCRCDSASGYLFEFDLYTGRKEYGTEYGLGESVVLQLTEKLTGLGSEVYIDNFFNSPLLQYELKKRQIKSCGTVRSNRKNIPQNLPLDKNMKRGDIYTSSFEGISFVKWMDNRAVTLLTNFLSPVETDTVRRRIAGSAEKINVKCPKAIMHYNKNMGGVDLMDQRKSFYELDRKSKIKYYLRLFFDLLDISVNNSYVIYTECKAKNLVEGTQLNSLEFRRLVARNLIAGYSSRQREFPIFQSSKITVSKRPASSHSMLKANVRKRCVQCAKINVENRTNNYCNECNVHLCFTTNRNCFAEHHN